MKKIRVLISGVGSPTPRGIARSLKENKSAKTDYLLYGTDINKYAVGLYNNQVFEKTFVTHSCKSDFYWS